MFKNCQFDIFHLNLGTPRHVATLVLYMNQVTIQRVKKSQPHPKLSL